MSKKIPPSRVYSAITPTKHDVASDPEQIAQLLHMLRDVSAQVDENSRLKQIAKAKVEKKAASDRDTDLEGSSFTDFLGSFASNESFSMHVDEIVPPPKRVVGRTPSTGPVASTSRPTASSSKEDTAVNTCAPCCGTPNKSAMSPTARYAPATQPPQCRVSFVPVALRHHAVALCGFISKGGKANDASALEASAAR
ncbi:hypothetical protein DFH29DRAFT_1082671 [Suillus ampliporus]|nr:hypothetical protein DFH29DRAFT_1082671 [Suillus ampliporus]